jgi:hypothetical protein
MGASLRFDSLNASGHPPAGGGIPPFRDEVSRRGGFHPLRHRKQIQANVGEGHGASEGEDEVERKARGVHSTAACHAALDGGSMGQGPEQHH